MVLSFLNLFLFLVGLSFRSEFITSKIFPLRMDVIVVDCCRKLKFAMYHAVKGGAFILLRIVHIPPIEMWFDEMHETLIMMFRLQVAS